MRTMQGNVGEDHQRRQGQSGQSGLPSRALPQHQRDFWQSAAIL